MKNILGIWDGHDAGAALMIDGQLVCAANEERFTRRKLEVGFPHHAIRACLTQARLSPEEIHCVAGCTTDPAKTLSRLWPASQERYYRLRRRLASPSPLDPLTRLAKYHLTEWPGNRLTRWLSTRALHTQLASLGLDHCPLTLLDHHLCHAATAAHGLGQDNTLILTLDGVGDGRAGSLYHFQSGRLMPLASIAARDSAAIFFEQVTTLLHLRELEDEGKVMALADYAVPIPDADNPLLDLIQVDHLTLRARCHAGGLARQLKKIFWHHPQESFAAMAQRALEHWVLTLIRNAIRSTGIHRLALAGGLFANVRLNGQIRMLPEVSDCFIFPHMGDGGLAVGAACLAAPPQTPLLTDLHLGPESTPAELEQAVRDSGLPFRRLENPALESARLLTQGKIIGWFQGRMEYGPRALGGRSVLARPDRNDLRDALNLRLKKRAWYQPFCPSMLDSEAARLLADHHGAPNRFMTSLYHLRPEFQTALAGVMGRGGSCRPQMVADDASTPFAALLQAMQQLTGFGVVLNTSFNPHGAPLVNTPAQALEAFRAMGLDHLVLGNWCVDPAPDQTNEV
ncbi:MAG: hypothetical protein HQL91_10805 [Magnetococcales bacterium]|nr:hypothetical protein [Magnetococcales bacterium]